MPEQLQGVLLSELKVMPGRRAVAWCHDHQAVFLIRKHQMGSAKSRASQFDPACHLFKPTLHAHIP